MAAYYVLLRPWLHFGYGEAIVRLLSVLPGVLSIPLMYVLGRRLFGAATRDARGGVVCAQSLRHLRLAGGARLQLSWCWRCLLSTYLFRSADRIADVQLGVSPTRIVAGLTCYFHYFGVLVPAAHCLSLFGDAARTTAVEAVPAGGGNHLRYRGADLCG